MNRYQHNYFDDSMQSDLDVASAEYNTHNNHSVMEQGYDESKLHNNYYQYNSTNCKFNNYYTSRGVKRRMDSVWSAPYPKRLNTAQTNPCPTWNYGERPGYWNEQLHQRSIFSGSNNMQHLHTSSYQQREKKKRNNNNEKIGLKSLKPIELSKSNTVKLNINNKESLGKKCMKLATENVTVCNLQKPDKAITDGKAVISQLNETIVEVANNTGTNNDDDEILYADKEPSVSAKHRIEKAFVTIMNRFWHQHANVKYRVATKIPNIVNDVKKIFRERLRNLLLNKTVGTPEEIITQFRNKYPPESDVVLTSLVDGTENVSLEEMSALLMESDDPQEYFKSNMKMLLIIGLSNLFNNIQKTQEIRFKNHMCEDHQIQERLTEPIFSNEEVKRVKGKRGVPINHKDIIYLIEAELPKILPKFSNFILNLLCEDEKVKATKSHILSKTKLLTNTTSRKNSLNGNKNLKTTGNKTVGDISKNTTLPQKITHTFGPNKQNNTFNLSNNTIEASKRKSQEINITEKTVSSNKVNINMKTTAAVDEVNEKSNASHNKKTVTAIVPTGHLNESRKAIGHIQVKFAENTISAKPNMEQVQNRISVKTDKNIEKENTFTNDTGKIIASKNILEKKEIDALDKNNPNSTKSTLKDIISLEKEGRTRQEFLKKQNLTQDITAHAVAINKTIAVSNTTVPPVILNTINKEESTSMASHIKEPYYAKIICHPVIPPRPLMKTFLNQYNNTMIKKHKSIRNLLIAGFCNKEDCDKMLVANQTVIDGCTIFIRGYKQANVEDSPICNNPKEMVTPDVSEAVVKVKNELKEDQLDDILNQDLEDQITNLLLSIKQEREEEYEVTKE